MYLVLTRGLNHDVQGEDMVRRLQAPATAVDAQLAAGRVRFFARDGAATDDEDEDNGGDDASGADGSDGSESGSGADSDDASDHLSSGDESDGGAAAAAAPAQSRRPRRPVSDLPGQQHASDDGAAPDDFAATLRRLRRRTGAAAAIDGEASSSSSDPDGASADSGSDEDFPGSDPEAGEESGDAEEHARWRGRMLAKQAALFSTRASDLRRFVYSATAVASGGGDHDSAATAGASLHGRDAGSHSADAAQVGSDDGGDGGSDEELFVLKKPGSSPTQPAASSARAAASAAGAPAAAAADINAVDSALPPPLDAVAIAEWLAPPSAAGSAVNSAPGGAQMPSDGRSAAAQALRKRFVTGGDAAFEAQRARAAGRGAAPGDVGSDEDADGKDGAGEEEEEVFGDFEDVEALARAGACPFKLCRTCGYHAGMTCLPGPCALCSCDRTGTESCLSLGFTGTLLLLQNS